jgi:hypothetical protein
MSRRGLAFALALVALVGVAPRRAAAQGASIVGAFSAGVQILYPPLSGAGIRPLTFGSLIPGAGATTVLPSSASAAEYRVTGTTGHRSITITIALPATLVGPGGQTIPLNFNGNYAALCEIDATGVCQAASYFEWNPVTTPTQSDTPQRYKPGRPRYTYNDYSVYLGGVATPSATQSAGRYTGAIGMTLVLN